MSDTELILSRIEAMETSACQRHVEVVRRLSVVEQRVGATNGRVAHLELWRAGREAVRQTLSWRVPLAVAITSGAVVSIVTWALSQ